MKENREKLELIRKYITVVERYIVLAYLICMSGIFPLYYKEKYYKIGDAKFEFFWNVSLGFIGISIIFIIINFIVQRIFYKLDSSISYKKNVSVKRIEADGKYTSNFLWEILDNLSALDYAVFIYAICVLLSYAFSDFKDYALKGAEGWEMGLCSQMIFVAIYFILSRQKIFGNLFVSDKAIHTNSKISEQKKSLLSQRRMMVSIIAIHLISSVVTFILGILHRFDVDPLGMYAGLNIYQKIEFLSTIGQATWFSSYVCTVFAIGVTLFYVSEKRWIRITTGIYSIISFGILVTQNSDSAFMAIAGCMLLLGYFSVSDMKRWYRFLQIFCLMWGTFGGIGILQRILADRAIPLDSLSVFFSQSVVTWAMFVISLVLTLFYRNYCKTESEKKTVLNSENKTNGKNRYHKETIRNSSVKQAWIMRITKGIYQGILLFLAVIIIGTVIFIYLNTRGYLLDWFGYQSTNHYLLFDYHWGSNRGSTWIISWQAFLQMPFYQKLFGVGPDSVSAYLYSIPDIYDFLHNLWGNMRLTNAHNEYLNSLLCYGVVGVTAWLAVLIGGICHFYDKAKDKPFMIAFALCIVGYVCHNIFCYQQVCCTPFLFLILGIGESLTKSENFNTIK